MPIPTETRRPLASAPERGSTAARGPHRRLLRTFAHLPFTHEPVDGYFASVRSSWPSGRPAS